MGIVHENAHFRGSETDFPWREKTKIRKKNKKSPRGKEIGGTIFFLKHTHQKHTPGSTDFSSAPNTLGTIEVRSHAAIVRFSPGGEGGGGAPDPPRFFSFSFESIPMPEVKEGLIPPQGYFLFDTFCFTSNVPSC